MDLKENWLTLKAKYKIIDIVIFLIAFFIIGYIYSIAIFFEFAAYVMVGHITNFLFKSISEDLFDAYWDFLMKLYKPFSYISNKLGNTFATYFGVIISFLYLFGLGHLMVSLIIMIKG